LNALPPHAARFLGSGEYELRQCDEIKNQKHHGKQPRSQARPEFSEYRQGPQAETNSRYDDQNFAPNGIHCGT